MASIRLNKQEQTIKVVNRRETIKLSRPTTNVSLKHTGKIGPQGDQGVIGVGVPTGGTDGQVLSKVGSSDYDFEWLTPVAPGDKYATAEFTVSSEVAFAHGLDKYPSVCIIDSAGEEVIGGVEYVDTNSVIARFNAPFSGRIVCN